MFELAVALLALKMKEKKKESLRTVGKEILTDKGLQQGLGQTLYQNKKNIGRTKGKKPQMGRTSVRIGRWKVEKR